MAEKFFLDPEGAAQAARDLRETGDRLGAAYDTLTSVLDAHDGCWGDDDIGKSFAKNYVDPAAEVRTGGESAVQGLHDAADGIDESSELYLSVDEDNAAQIDAAYEPEAQNGE